MAPDPGRLERGLRGHSQAHPLGLLPARRRDAGAAGRHGRRGCHQPGQAPDPRAFQLRRRRTGCGPGWLPLGHAQGAPAALHRGRADERRLLRHPDAARCVRGGPGGGRHGQCEATQRRVRRRRHHSGGPGLQGGEPARVGRPQDRLQRLRGHWRRGVRAVPEAARQRRNPHLRGRVGRGGSGRAACGGPEPRAEGKAWPRRELPRGGGHLRDRAQPTALHQADRRGSGGRESPASRQGCRHDSGRLSSSQANGLRSTTVHVNNRCSCGNNTNNRAR
mmetsp:Transcript_26204/g.53958  ORF Transcript_26204/g.53958 Transcript_26204/m.53958 type:complete len:277 (+) Transcript_26204:117-947(+)